MENREKCWCDFCGVEFILNPQTLTTNIKGKKVWYLLIQCPECNKKYFSFLYNQFLKKKIDKRQTVLERLRNCKSAEENKKLVKKSDRLRKEIREQHNKLKEEFREHMKEE